MSVRQTSKRAYAEVINTLGKRQREVLVCLNSVRNATNAELATFLSLPINQITPRVFELRSKGIVKELGKRRCKVTGRTVYCWSTEAQQSLF